MTTILNPMMADHESRFEHLARQVERISRIVDYDEGERHNAWGNNEGIENIFQNENHIPNRENPRVVLRGENDDDVLNGLRAYLVEKVRQTELMKMEKEKHRSEQRSKSKPFTRKEKVAYVTMESSKKEFDFETEVDLAELKKGPPYVCSLLKKLPGSEKSNDSKPKTGKKYSFEISKSDQIFDQKIKDRDVSMCPQCNAVFDAEAATIFEKERMKKELAHREHQARQR
ncbi:hypothetical protein Ahy_A10g049071 [Arachis hypogaea]|uniref:Uncharacterized protein n=1 Tax=Arachis hypogaea TaxID=3818 RepID=A0A445B6J9_ARAHY|nr:hypothetical protein Ahy_A10g049071 [Arachis hypogaea]